jgi:transcriptional regulator with XRE-family HTH domain
MTPEELLDIRQKLGLSQSALARMLARRGHGEASAISRMERGKVPISHHFARRLYALAGITTCPSCGQVLQQF